MTPQFDHERLNVYQESIRFVAWADDLLDTVPKSLAVHNQLDRASTSVPLNIAEGNGKHTPADRCRFFDIARGSALECAACLDVLVAKGKVESTTADEGSMAALSSRHRGIEKDATQATHYPGLLRPSFSLAPVVTLFSEDQ